MSSGSDSDNASESSPTSILSAKVKELRNKIISVKKSVTKGDKKQKKAIQEELESLETLLATKQEELQKLKNSTDSTVSENVSNENILISKARLKRERRKEEKAAEWEANRQAALEEIASRPDLALEESKAFAHKLSQNGFRIIEVAADGHCLFSAIGCQLNPPKDHWELRSLAAKYIADHRSEFECFIDCDFEASDPNQTTDKFVDYCRKIESTGMWGGQIELEALSRALNISISVLQSDGPELCFNPSPKPNDSETDNDKSQQQIYLSFHRYAFSLGEHYNALLPIDS